MRKLVLMVAAFVAMSSTIATAQDAKDKKVVPAPAVVATDKAGWTKIGETTANFKMDKDAIAVIGNDHFKSIRLKVTDAGINITDLEVWFEDGTKQDVMVRSEIKAGGETRAIDLKGGSPSIKRVVMLYKTLPNAADEKAHVELYGLK